MKRETDISRTTRKTAGFARLLTVVFLTVGMFFVPGVMSSRSAQAAGSVAEANAGMDANWTEWTAGDKIFDFTMNGARSSARVSRPGFSWLAQFGVVVTVTDDPAPNQYTYLSRNGNGATSAVGYSIGAAKEGALAKARFLKGRDVKDVLFFKCGSQRNMVQYCG